MYNKKSHFIVFYRINKNTLLLFFLTKSHFIAKNRIKINGYIIRTFWAQGYENSFAKKNNLHEYPFFFEKMKKSQKIAEKLIKKITC